MLEVSYWCDKCHRLVASLDAPQSFTKLLPKPVGSKAKTSFPLRKASFFFSSKKKKIKNIQSR